MNNFFGNRLKKHFGILLFALCLSCTRSEAIRQTYLPAYHQGNFEQAETALTQVIDKQLPKNDFRKSNDALWLLLDRATIHMAAGETSLAIADYKLALESLDFYRKNTATEALGEVLLQDSVAAYGAQDFEQILARIYFALTLLQNGDENNAFALLRQAEEAQQIKRQQYRSSRATKDYVLVDNALGKYLFALLLEKQGDMSNARILYDQTKSLMPNLQIEEDIERLEKKNACATILFIAHNGKAPHKISITAPASIASAAALELFMHTQKVPIAYSSLGGVAVPEFVDTPAGLPTTLYATVGSEKKLLQSWYDVNAVARQQLKQNLPVIVARGVARYLIRRGLVAAAYSQDQLQGSIMDITMLFSNMATQADTRAWNTLPYRIDLARFDLPAGTYPIEIQSDQTGDTARYNIRVSPGDVCLINIFHFLPRVQRINIPPRFLLETSYSEMAPQK